MFIIYCVMNTWFQTEKVVRNSVTFDYTGLDKELKRWLVN